MTTITIEEEVSEFPDLENPNRLRPSDDPSFYPQFFEIGYKEAGIKFEETKTIPELMQHLDGDCLIQQAATNGWNKFVEEISN